MAQRRPGDGPGRNDLRCATVAPGNVGPEAGDLVARGRIDGAEGVGKRLAADAAGWTFHNRLWWNVRYLNDSRDRRAHQAIAVRRRHPNFVGALFNGQEFDGCARSRKERGAVSSDAPLKAVATHRVATGRS